MIDLEWLRRLIDLVDESDIDSLEVRRFATRIRIAKSPPGGSTGAVPVAYTSPAGAPPRAESAPEEGGAPAVEGERGQPAEEAGRAAELYEVKSPMVGTFYRAPAPDAPPYVEVGDTVKQGHTLCILEAMKLMNELESEVSGTIREICVQNAEPVEFGQVLYRIEVDGTG